MMKNAMKSLMKTMKGWYGRLEDLTEDLADMGFEIEEANREYITVYREDSGDDSEFVLRLGGTERTIIVDDIEKV